MEQSAINSIINSLANALQKRDYDNFVNYFTDNAIFEIPFGVNGGTTITGKANIQKHFEAIRQNPVTRSIELTAVTAKIQFAAADKTVTVEYFTKGKSLSTNETFEIQSSIALLTFDESGIVYYKDFPNTLGLAKKAGVLPQLAATWTK